MNKKRILLWLAITAWLASLALPAMSAGGEVNFGYQILLIGWIGPLGGIIAWYANLFALIAIICGLAKSYKIARGFSVAAIIVGLTTVLVRTIPGDIAISVDYLAAGFYVWECSFVLLTIYFYFKSAEMPLPQERVRKSRKRVLLLVCLTGAAIVIAYYGYGTYLQYQRQQTLQLVAPLPAPLLGLLLPTNASVPSGFTLATSTYNRRGYSVLYEEQDLCSSCRLGSTIIFAETLAGKGSSYATDVQEEQQFNGITHANLQQFTYENYPGTLFTSMSVNPTGFANYDLYWNNNGNLIQITIGDVPSTLFTNQSVIDILGTLKSS